jgi:hypothetical protein
VTGKDERPHLLEMASVGPQLPFSSAVKRKRDEEPDTLNDHSDTSTPSRHGSHTPDSSTKRPRTIGPALPPASLEERPQNGPDEESDTSSDDDDFGPSLPGAGTSTVAPGENNIQASGETGPQASSKSQRDEWMMVPPSNSDWSARIDPTKLKARKFNTGKGANAPSQATTTGGDSRWTETPEQKRARLEREMMGITDTSAANPKVTSQETVKVAAASQKIREYTVSETKGLWNRPALTLIQEKTRATPRSDDHQKSNPREKEDDPSARPFDREKDIAAGMKISASQRKEMMKKAADFGSRFSSAKYL